MRQRIFNHFLLTMVIVFVSHFATAENFAVGVKGGTLGLGAELSVSLLPRLTGRIGLNRWTYSYDGTESDVDYDIDLKLDTFVIMIDFYPFKSNFHTTAGLMKNGNTLEMDASLDPSETYEIGEVEYTAAQIGLLSGSLDFNDLCPYLGIGWGNPFEKKKQWEIYVDLGLLFQGSPDVSLSASNGLLSDNAVFQNELRKEEGELEDDIDGYTIYPVIMVGVAFRF